MKKLLFLCAIASLGFASTVYIHNDEEISLTFNKKLNGLTYYITPHNEEVAVKDELIIKFKKAASISHIINQHAIISIKDLGNRFYLLKVENKDTLFETAVSLARHKDVLLAHPNFIRKRIRR